VCVRGDLLACLRVFPSIGLTRSLPTVTGSCFKNQPSSTGFLQLLAVDEGILNLRPQGSNTIRSQGALDFVVVSPFKPSSPSEGPMRVPQPPSNIIIRRKTGTTGVVRSLGFPDSLDSLAVVVSTECRSFVHLCLQPATLTPHLDARSSTCPGAALISRYGEL